jgi:hypothetical protein
VDFKQYFEPGSRSAGLNPNRSCVADDIEMKWEKTGYVGRIKCG